MAPTPAPDPTLHALLTSTLALLAQFAASLHPTSLPTSPTTTPTSTPTVPNPLALLSDSASLIKAHTTKLSLLAINKPFTPSAISRIVKELGASCLPALMSGAQQIVHTAETWGGMMGKEVQTRVRRVFNEMSSLLDEVLVLAEMGGEPSPASSTTTSGRKQRRDSLLSTGLVWEACDAVVALHTLGLPGLALQKATQYREQLSDAITELRDWIDGADLDTEGRVDALLDSDDEGVSGDREGGVEDLFNAANSLPGDRPELRTLAEEAEGRLKRVVLLYKAVEKRRLGSFPAVKGEGEVDEVEVKRLDDVMAKLRRIPHLVDEMAGLLYDLDEKGAREVLQSCLGEAITTSKLVEINWKGEEDAMSQWLRKWRDAVG